MHISINYFSDYDKCIFVRVVALVAPLHGQWVRGSVADSGWLLMRSSAWLILLSWNGSDLQPAMHRPHDNPSIEQFATRQYIRNSQKYLSLLHRLSRVTSINQPGRSAVSPKDDDWWVFMDVLWAAFVNKDPDWPSAKIYCPVCRVHCIVLQATVLLPVVYNCYISSHRQL